MTTIFFYVLLFQIKDWDKICEEEGKMTSPIICYILLGVHYCPKKLPHRFS